MSDKMCIILVGPPCCGKSSVGKTVASRLGIDYISSGDIARRMAQSNTQVNEDLVDGKMAPENEMRRIISEKLWQRFIKMGKNVIILDGFPRFGEQAVWLRDLLPHIIDIKYVLLNVPLSTIIERSADRNRNDDKSLEQRLKYYYNTTYKELSDHIDIVIDANENTVDECSALLIHYIEEVRKYC